MGAPTSSGNQQGSGGTILIVVLCCLFILSLGGGGGLAYWGYKNWGWFKGDAANPGYDNTYISPSGVPITTDDDGTSNDGQGVETAAPYVATPECAVGGKPGPWDKNCVIAECTNRMASQPDKKYQVVQYPDSNKVRCCPDGTGLCQEPGSWNSSSQTAKDTDLRPTGTFQVLNAKELSVVQGECTAYDPDKKQNYQVLTNPNDKSDNACCPSDPKMPCLKPGSFTSRGTGGTPVFEDPPWRAELIKTAAQINFAPFTGNCDAGQPGWEKVAAQCCEVKRDASAYNYANKSVWTNTNFHDLTTNNDRKCQQYTGKNGETAFRGRPNTSLTAWLMNEHKIDHTKSTFKRDVSIKPPAHDGNTSLAGNYDDSYDANNPQYGGTLWESHGDSPIQYVVVTWGNKDPSHTEMNDAFWVFKSDGVSTSAGNGGGGEPVSGNSKKVANKRRIDSPMKNTNFKEDGVIENNIEGEWVGTTDGMVDGS